MIAHGTRRAAARPLRCGHRARNRRCVFRARPFSRLPRSTSTRVGRVAHRAVPPLAPAAAAAAAALAVRRHAARSAQRAANALVQAASTIRHPLRRARPKPRLRDPKVRGRCGRPAPSTGPSWLPCAHLLQAPTTAPARGPSGRIGPIERRGQPQAAKPRHACPVREERADVLLINEASAARPILPAHLCVAKKTALYSARTDLITWSRAGAGHKTWLAKQDAYVGRSHCVPARMRRVSHDHRRAAGAQPARTWDAPVASL
jgi:hypothetical protein